MKTMLFAAAVVIALAACAPERDTEEPAAAPGNNKAVTENTAAPPSVDRSDEDDVAVLTSEGWGPLRIGMTLAEVIAAAGPDSDPAAIGGPEPEQCDQFRPADAPDGMLVMIEQGRLTRISLSDPAKLETDKGLGVGDGEAAVKAAYGDAITASPHEYLHPLGGYLTVWTVGGTSEPYVRSPQARGIRYEIGEDGTVTRIHAGGPSIQYVEGCS